MPEKFKGKKTKKVTAVIEEEHLLFIIDMCDDDVSASICTQVDIQEVYLSSTIISIDYGFGNSKRQEDCDDDVEPPMSVNENNDIDVDYEFHNNVAFMKIKLGLEDKDVEENEQGLSLIRPPLQALNSPNIWISNTGATRHSTKYKQGGIDSRPSTSRTRGIYGQAIKPSIEVDCPGMYCDKNDNDQFALKLQDVDVIPESHYHYNLINLTKLMEEGHKVTGSKKDGLSVQKGRRVITFDIRVETQKGLLWCAYTKQPESKGEVSAGISSGRSDNQPNESVQELTPSIKMSNEQAHAILGHASEGATRRTAAALGMLITREEHSRLVSPVQLQKQNRKHEQ